MIKVFIIGKIEDWKLKELLDKKRREKIIVYKWREVEGCLDNMHLKPEIVIEGETDKEEWNKMRNLRTFIKTNTKDTLLLRI